MATGTKKPRAKKAKRTTAKQAPALARGGTRKSAAKQSRAAATKRGPVTRTAKRPATKATKATKATTAKGATPKNAAPKRASSKRGKSPMSSVARVAKEVAEQAGRAMAEGVEALKEIGESIAERVNG